MTLCCYILFIAWNYTIRSNDELFSQRLLLCTAISYFEPILQRLAIQDFNTNTHNFFDFRTLNRYLQLFTIWNICNNNDNRYEKRAFFCSLFFALFLSSYAKNAFHTLEIHTSTNRMIFHIWYTQFWTQKKYVQPTNVKFFFVTLSYSLIDKIGAFLVETHHLKYLKQIDSVSKMVGIEMTIKHQFTKISKR